MREKIDIHAHYFPPILYGSDTPFTPLPLCGKLAETMDQGLTAEMQELVYRENPKRLLCK